MSSHAYICPILSGMLGFFIGCGSGGGGSDCQAGAYLCPCLNGVCQIGLVCDNNFCVSVDGDTTGDGDPDTGDGDGDTGPGDGDGDTGPGDGDGDTGPGDGDGDTGPGDGDGDPGDDDDNDGVPNGQDNCPDDYNPNQRDFDGNGDGNVCDLLEFTGVSGNLQTEFVADAGFVPCTDPVTWTVTSGTVTIALDDDAALALFEIDDLVLTNFDAVCVDFFTTTFSFSNATIVNAGIPFPVEMDHSPQAHANGTIAGVSDVPHPITLEATASVVVDNEPAVVSPLVFDGQLWNFTANITGGGSSGSLSWNAPNEQITDTDVIAIEVPVPIQFDVSFVGLSGSLSF